MRSVFMSLQGKETRAAPSLRGPTVTAAVVALLGTGLAGLGYFASGTTFNVNEFLGPGLFWCAALFFLFSVPLRSAASAFSRAIRTSIGAGVFVFYLLVHLLLYGFLFDAVLASVFGKGSFVTGPSFLVATNLFTPPSFTSLVFDIAYNPVIVVTAPPVFSTALTFYGVSVALTIDVLVVASIRSTMELSAIRKATGKARSFVILPALGVVLGATCCLSVAGLVSLASPTAALLDSTPYIYYSTYFLFPCLAVVILYLNLRAMNRIAAAA